MAWIKETKKQGAVSKNKTLRFPSDGGSASAKVRRTRARCAAPAAHAIQSLPGNPWTPRRLFQRSPRRGGASHQAGRWSERWRAPPREVSGAHSSAATLAP